MKYLWALIGVAYALLCLYVGYLFITSAVGPRLAQKGALLQVPPLLGGLALIVLALPLLWSWPGPGASVVDATEPETLSAAATPLGSAGAATIAALMASDAPFLRRRERSPTSTSRRMM